METAAIVNAPALPALPQSRPRQRKQIRAFGNGYTIDIKGVVRNRAGAKLSQRIDSRGYYIVRIYDGNAKGKDIRVHRLVALAFIPNPRRVKIVDHINDVKTDNRAINLQWLTHGENMAKKYEKHGKECRPVVRLRMDGTVERVFKNIVEAADFHGVSYWGLYAAVKSKRACYGFRWRYLRQHAK